MASLILRYDTPAADWNAALPIGNGRLGAMIFGGAKQERLQLNEESLWDGTPHNYEHVGAASALPEIRRLVFAGEWAAAQQRTNEQFMSVPLRQKPYQTVGDLLLDFGEDAAAQYERTLDLDTATATTSFTTNGVRYTRTYFASYPADNIVVRLTADKPGSINVTTRWKTPQPETVIHRDKDTLTLATIPETSGERKRVHFAAMVRALPEGKNAIVSTSAEGALTIANADAVTLLVSIATSYLSYKDIDGDAVVRARKPLDAATSTPYAKLYAAHLADYQPLFRRVTLELGDTVAPLTPTNKRIAAFADTDDPSLVALHFQYGRYLLLSSSRPGNTQPANLQGIWNDSMTPPWDSKFTVNINTEMNYWPAGPANLLECYEPLFRLVYEIAETGKGTAKSHYNANGWLCHHNTDAWRATAPVDGAFWGMWQTGGAWLCKSFRDYYDFTGDKKNLEKAYPVLKGAATFFLETLVPEPHSGHLVTCPSNSPENAHHPGASICAGPTMDMQIVRDLFDTVMLAADVLKKDSNFREAVKKAREHLAPMQVGKLGQLQEWEEDWDADAPEQNHRHISHLYGLHPSAQITPEHTPELFAAARKSLERRGDMATGWSLAWKINLWARLRDGEHAYTILRGLLTPERTAPNLFDLHPPFQIDGNFGATSGVCEMLLQSHQNEIHLLPALPSLWKKGTVRGLLARGGFDVGIRWENGELTEATVKSRNDATCRVRYKDNLVTVQTKAGKGITLNNSLR